MARVTPADHYNAQMDINIFGLAFFRIDMTKVDSLVYVPFAEGMAEKWGVGKPERRHLPRIACGHVRRKAKRFSPPPR